MNRVILCGRLSKDPEEKVTGETQIARFTLAVDRRYKKGEERTADFINCIAFSGLAKFVVEYFKKGDAMTLEGRINTGSYKNKNGQTVYTTDVVADSVEFPLGKKGNSDAAKSEPKNDGFMNIPDSLSEELPFN